VRLLGLLAGALLGLTPARVLAEGLVFDDATCSGVDLRRYVDEILGRAARSADQDCQRDAELRNMVAEIQRGKFAFPIHIRCAAAGEWPHNSCGDPWLNQCHRGPEPAMPTWVFINPTFKPAVDPYKECPMFPPAGDPGVALIHELTHARDIVTGHFDGTPFPGTITYKDQVLAIQMENILRRAAGQCQRRQSGGFKEPIGDVKVAAVEECDCDLMNVDRYGVKPCTDKAATCCGRRCINTVTDPSNCGGCGRSCTGSCCGGRCGGQCAAARPACDYLDAATASAILDRAIKSSDGNPSYMCNYYGKPLPGDRLDHATLTLSLVPRNGVDIAAFDRRKESEAAALHASTRHLTDLGLSAFVIGQERGFVQLHVLGAESAFTLSLLVKAGLPPGSVDRLILLARSILARTSGAPLDISVEAREPRESPGVDDRVTVTELFALDDVAATSRGTAVRIDVLSNDSRTGTLPVTVVVGLPIAGTAVVNPDSSITYTPNPSFTGRDHFEYTVTSGAGGRATGAVDVTVK